MNKRVLIVDNDPEFLSSRAEQLQASGYEVFQATSSEQAEQFLNRNWLHVMIIDVRLRDEKDDKDVSGLSLAKKKLYQSIPKIILTKYPSYQYVRQALGPALDGLPPAVEFLAKQDGPEAMVRAVEEAFVNYLRINWNLVFRWEELLSSFHLAYLIDPSLDNTLRSERSRELEDLFRRLFYESNQITISRLFAIGEKKITLAVFAFSEQGISSRYVVTCGQRDVIQQEKANYEKFAPKTTSEGGTAKCATVETVHFAVIAYTLTGAHLEEIITFDEFYQQNSVEMAITALDYLFSTTLAQWHRQGTTLKEKETLNKAFVKYLGLSEITLARSELEPRIQAIQSHLLANNLFRFDEALLKLLFDLIGSSEAINARLQYGIIHSRLNGNNILVDRQGRTWLVDFGQLEQGPLICDYVSLEKIIKFDLLISFDEQERYELERYLLTATGSEERAIPEDLSSDMEKAVQVINHIRQQALSKVINHNMKAYQVGLLFSTIAVLSTYEPDIYYTRSEFIRYLHSFASIGLLCKELTPPPPTYDKPHSPWLDQDKTNYEIWFEGKWITFTPTEYRLLWVLYQQTIEDPDNPHCTYEIIGKGVYGSYDKKMGDDTNIQGLVKRLRGKIQQGVPTTYQYIENIRGVGYSLKLNYHQSSG